MENPMPKSSRRIVRCRLSIVINSVAIDIEARSPMNIIITTTATTLRGIDIGSAAIFQAAQSMTATPIMVEKGQSGGRIRISIDDLAELASVPDTRLSGPGSRDLIRMRFMPNPLMISGQKSNPGLISDPTRQPQSAFPNPFSHHFHLRRTPDPHEIVRAIAYTP
jgi:hypothetical protein